MMPEARATSGTASLLPVAGSWCVGAAAALGGAASGRTSAPSTVGVVVASTVVGAGMDSGAGGAVVGVSAGGAVVGGAVDGVVAGVTTQSVNGSTEIERWP